MKRFWGGVILGALSLGAGVGLTATAAWLIARASQEPPVLYLMVAVVAVRAFGISRPALRYAERLITHDSAFRILAEARAKVYDALIPLAPARLSSQRRGDVFSQLVSDVDAVQDRLLRVRAPIVTAALLGVGSAVLALWLSVPAGLALALALLVASVAAPAAGSFAARRASAELADARAHLADHVVDVIHGCPDLVAYGGAEAALARVDAADAHLTRLQQRTAWAAGLGAGLSSLVAGLAVIVVAALSAPTVRGGGLSSVTFAVLVFIPLAAFEAAAALPRAGVVSSRVRRSFERLGATTQLAPAVHEPATPRAAPAGPFHVCLSGVSAGWEAGSPVIHQIELDLPPGRKVAVVGESGAGKSTLAAVLMRFVDYSGSYVINGVPANELGADDVRGVVGLMATDAHVFASTLRENVKLARPNATDDEIAAALRRARFDRPLDTWLGEGGSLISGGERQRVALARVLLADYPVLVLDEPTAHLDNETAAELIDDVLAAAAGRTVVLITHRPEGLDQVDDVIRLAAGRIVGDLTPALR